MRISLLTIALLFSLHISLSDDDTLEWINENSIEIEDSNQNSELKEFDKAVPERFSNAKIFGFGEATHNSKEFFDLKAKFFRYLVENQDVKTFIMEDAFQAEKGINEWISGGEGEKETIANNFHIGFWYTKEVVNLLLWMRLYNKGRPKGEQLRFYGMDIQSGKGLNKEIRDFVKKNNLDIDEELLAIADDSSNQVFNSNQARGWAEKHMPKLRQIEKSINEFRDLNPNQRDEANVALRSINYLIQFTNYVEHTETEIRDSSMFENVKWIIENQTKNGKAFIWAHNEHINKAEMYYLGSRIKNLGRHLKDFYKEDYFSVGFDFGGGNLRGYINDKKEGGKWKNYYVPEPIKKTYAQTLWKADKEIFFLDMKEALLTDPTNFFSTKNRNILVAAGGYQPKPLHKVMVNKVYTDFYDGLIFVKNVSLPEPIN
ncbi:erythromycin esterase family protein [Algoriphagus sediminis]|uniref:Erythromycin esterase family protein n=1 Tax=Algoriphagus sediminis TaxID=3057113 RepID=A0ABT7YDF6_9BACT|nr:erythromycin esterase family protein [Algoriphagus sediminis]MDN3204541.1 erythromycin esterase family protein [Algoriphagus sediminis]